MHNFLQWNHNSVMGCIKIPWHPLSIVNATLTLFFFIKPYIHVFFSAVGILAYVQGFKGACHLKNV